MPLSIPAAHTLERALNALIALDPGTRARLPALQGKIIDLHLQGLEWHIFVLVHAERVEIMRFFDGEIDTTLRGAPLSMASLAVSQRALFAGEVEIVGDIGTGERFKRLLDALAIDWEELLSQLVGDIAAHQIGNGARGVQDWLGHAVDTFGTNVGEYLREESLSTPTQGECEHFYCAVDTLRADADRLEARLQQLRAGLDRVI